MNIFQVDGKLSIDISNVLINGKKADLNVVKISSTDYDKLVKENKCDASTIYVVESDNIDACNEQIKNVANPTDAQDAVNKQYFEQELDRKVSNCVKYNDFYRMLKEYLNLINPNPLIK